MRRHNCILGGIVATIIFTIIAPSGSSAGDSLIIAGTGDSQSILRILGVVFERQNPGTRIIVPDSVGSDGGVKLLKQGQADLARTARPLKDHDKTGLIAHLFAYSPVVFAANPASGVVINDLSKDLIDALYAGRIVNWQDLDGRTRHRIYLLQREPGDSSRKVISGATALLMKRSPTAKTIYSTPETAAALRDIPYTLGYLPLSPAMEHGLKILYYQGVAPTDKAYPLRTSLYLISRGRPRRVAARFIKFMSEAKAAVIMRKNGVIPAQ